MQTFRTAATPTLCASTPASIQTAILTLRILLLQSEDIEVPSLGYCLDRGIICHLATPDRATTAITSPHADILLTVNHISAGNTEDSGTELLTGPEHLAGLGIKCQEMTVGTAAEHQAAGG